MQQTFSAVAAKGEAKEAESEITGAAGDKTAGAEVETTGAVGTAGVAGVETTRGTGDKIAGAAPIVQTKTVETLIITILKKGNSFLNCLNFEYFL
jgi:hypothetical protein